jgi:hypothetical protein
VLAEFGAAGTAVSIEFFQQLEPPALLTEANGLAFDDEVG